MGKGLFLTGGGFFRGERETEQMGGAAAEVQVLPGIAMGGRISGLGLPFGPQVAQFAQQTAAEFLARAGTGREGAGGQEPKRGRLGLSQAAHPEPQFLATDFQTFDPADEIALGRPPVQHQALGLGLERVSALGAFEAEQDLIIFDNQDGGMSGHKAAQAIRSVVAVEAGHSGARFGFDCSAGRRGNARAT